MTCKTCGEKKKIVEKTKQPTKALKTKIKDIIEQRIQPHKKCEFCD